MHSYARTRSSCVIQGPGMRILDALVIIFFFHYSHIGGYSPKERNLIHRTTRWRRFDFPFSDLCSVVRFVLYTSGFSIGRFLRFHTLLLISIVNK